MNGRKKWIRYGFVFISGDGKKKYYLTTITNECDCTSVLRPGNITIHGQQQNGQLVHAAMANTENVGTLEKYVVDTAAILRWYCRWFSGFDGCGCRPRRCNHAAT